MLFRSWIAFAADVQGRVMVDAGAKAVLAEGKASLLNTGVVKIESRFAAKDVVSIVDRQGFEFARGIAACSSDDVENALPHRKAAGRAGASVTVVRRDNIVLL